MANDDPGRQPFAGNCTANSTAVDSGFGQIGPVPAKKRLVVESVSAELVTSTSGALYTMQLNGPFTLFMIPALITDGVFGLRRYYATHAIRFILSRATRFSFRWPLPVTPVKAPATLAGYFPREVTGRERQIPKSTSWQTAFFDFKCKPSPSFSYPVPSIEAPVSKMRVTLRER